jgi:hypothetical protein
MKTCLIKKTIRLLNYLLMLITCEYHDKKKRIEIKKEDHSRYKKYSLFKCSCTKHEELQKQ